MSDAVISAQNICKSFGDINVLNDITIDIYDGDLTVIMGVSGAGKSTLLYALSGMDKITEGKVIYKGKEISNFNEKQMADLRANDFGFVFQQAYLVSNLTLFENVTVAGYLNKKGSVNEVNARTDNLLRKMGADKAKNRFPSQASGGEAQRAAVARALINSPYIIFADEPTGALNKANTEEVLNILSDLNENGQSILMVTHDIRGAIRGTRILYMEDGKIIDELKLPSYKTEDAKEREIRVNEWLSALRW